MVIKRLSQVGKTGYQKVINAVNIVCTGLSIQFQWLKTYKKL
jgi:hypothetical protein